MSWAFRARRERKQREIARAFKPAPIELAADDVDWSAVRALPPIERAARTFELSKAMGVSDADQIGRVTAAYALLAVEAEAWTWCRTHNALVRFESNGTVTVKVNDTQRRRSTLMLAVVALRAELER